RRFTGLRTNENAVSPICRVVCALAIHYASDRGAAFAEFCRVLRPGGAAVVSTQHPVIDWLRKGGSYFQPTLETDIWHTPSGDHPVHFWRESLSALCTAATDQNVDVARGAVLASLGQALLDLTRPVVSPVGHGHPAEQVSQQPLFFQPVGQRARRVQELQFHHGTALPGRVLGAVVADRPGVDHHVAEIGDAPAAHGLLPAGVLLSFPTEGLRKTTTQSGTRRGCPGS